MSDWISVIDDLPPKDEDVLICTEDSEGDRDVFKGFYDGEWWTQWVCGCQRIKDINLPHRVVAWMHCPKTYHGHHAFNMGDEVLEHNTGKRGVILRQTGLFHDVLFTDGHPTGVQEQYLEWTGRHFEEVRDLLQAIREGEKQDE